LLQRKPPGAARRLAGVSVVMVAATSAGLGAWAAQPPVAAKPVAARQPGSALATLAAPSAAPNTTPNAMPVAAPAQTARDTGLNPLAGQANPTSSGREMDTSREVHAEREVLPVPARVQAPSAGSIRAQMESTLAALPQPAPVSLALNAAEMPPKTYASPLSAETDAAVVPNTPSGMDGDPNARVCRAPQRMAGSDQFGPEACGYNYEWQKLAMNGKDLAPDGKTLIDRPTAIDPKGDGDPNALTCRTPKLVSSPQDWEKRFGPEVCRTNRFWADLTKNHQMLDAHGVVATRRSNIGNGGLYGPGGPGSCFGGGCGPGMDSGQPSQSSATGGPAPVHVP